MQVEVNFVAVLLAIASSFLVGGLWYSKMLFGEQWRVLIKMDKKTMKKGPAPKAWALTFFAAAIEAYVLAHMTYMVHGFFNAERGWMSVALTTAFWMWAGFQLSLLLTHDSFEQRPLKLTMINAAHQLTTLLVMGLIIGLFEV